jgi:hypothetical protein
MPVRFDRPGQPETGKECRVQVRLVAEGMEASAKERLAAGVMAGRVRQVRRAPVEEQAMPHAHLEAREQAMPHAREMVEERVMRRVRAEVKEQAMRRARQPAARERATRHAPVEERVMRHAPVEERVMRHAPVEERVMRRVRVEAQGVRVHRAGVRVQALPGMAAVGLVVADQVDSAAVLAREVEVQDVQARHSVARTSGA